jgi:putative membrane protein
MGPRQNSAAKGDSMFRQIVLCAALLVAAPAAKAAEPTDPQIAHIAYTADQIDIAAADQALKKTKNKDVHAFAETMKRDHTAVNEKALALVKNLGVKPEDNPTSQKLSKEAKDKEKELGGLSGAEFDRAYIANEVTYHETVNSALKDTLIPAAQNAELKALLQSALGLFTEHQKHAEQVKEKLK